MLSQDVVEKALAVLGKIGAELERHNRLQELVVEEMYVDAVIASIPLDDEKRLEKIDKARQAFAAKVYRTIEVETT